MPRHSREGKLVSLNLRVLEEERNWLRESALLSGRSMAVELGFNIRLGHIVEQVKQVKSPEDKFTLNQLETHCYRLNPNYMPPTKKQELRADFVSTHHTFASDTREKLKELAIASGKSESALLGELILERCGRLRELSKAVS